MVPYLIGSGSSTTFLPYVWFLGGKSKVESLTLPYWSFTNKQFLGFDDDLCIRIRKIELYLSKKLIKLLPLNFKLYNFILF